MRQSEKERSDKVNALDRHFARCISTDNRGVDEIDRELDEMIQVDPGEFNPPSRRKDTELARMLAILDNLPKGKDSQ